MIEPLAGQTVETARRALAATPGGDTRAVEALKLRIAQYDANAR